MLGKVKKWLGIEGVKLELELPDTIPADRQQIEGRMILFSMSAQTVTGIKMVLVERYQRGRGEQRRTDEYELGNLSIERRIEVPAQEPIELRFTMDYEPLRSEMDDLARRNVFYRGLVKVAKTFEQVDSQYFIIAEADVEGTALNPFDKKEVFFE